MGKIKRTEQFYNDQLAKEGKQRTLIPDIVLSATGEINIYYRESIVDSKLYSDSMDRTPWWKKNKKTKIPKSKGT